MAEPAAAPHTKNLHSLVRSALGCMRVKHWPSDRGGQGAHRGRTFPPRAAICGLHLDAQEYFNPSFSAEHYDEHTTKKVTIAAGRITAPRCQAKAKHSQEQCRKAVMRGKRVCRVHGENLLVHVLNKAENAAQRLRLYLGGKHARNVRYALRSSVR